MNYPYFSSNSFKKIFLFQLIFLRLAFLQAQTIQTDMALELTVCQESDTLKVTVYNDLSQAFSGLIVETQLPTGIEYVAGSTRELTSHGLTVLDSSNLERPTFGATFLGVGDSLKFCLLVKADPKAVNYLQQGNTLRVLTDLQYQGGNAQQYSNAFNLLYPALSITQVSPSTTQVNCGDQVTRTVTVVNAGYGKVDQIRISDVRNDARLSAVSASHGQWNATGDTLTLSSSDFQGIGNNDGFLDPNESILIVQTFQGSGCQDVTVTSEINTHWGCSGENLAGVSTYGHVQIKYQKPNISAKATPSLVTCFASGDLSGQKLEFTNNGQGTAKDLVLNLFKSSGSGYDQSLFSKIVAESFVYQIDGGTQVAISPDSVVATQSSGSYSCLGQNPVGQVFLSLPDLAPGQKLTLEWDMSHCAISVCQGEEVSGWAYSLAYEDGCAVNYSKSGTGQGTLDANMSIFTESPTDIKDQETKTFTFSISSYTNELPLGTGGRLRYRFDIPQGLAYSPAANTLNLTSGSSQWPALKSSWDAQNRVLEVDFALPVNFALPKSEVQLNLTGDCSVVGSTPGLTVDYGVSYIPDTTCSTVVSIPFLCNQSVEVDLHCPLSGPCQGVYFQNYSIVRTNFGQPDNNQDGLADNSGSLDLSKIKSQRVMVGDTLQGVFTGVVQSTGSSQWSYAYASSEIEKGTYLDAIDATLNIYDASAQAYYTVTVSNPSETVSGTNKTFAYDISAFQYVSQNAALNQWKYSPGDSIELVCRYRVSSNPGGIVEEVKVDNSLYLSFMANPSSGGGYSCGYYNGRFTLIGYFYNNSSKNNFTVNSCTRVIQQNFGMSIGDCCSNYAGGNLFPFEYRNWAEVNKARVVIPQNYQLVNSYVRMRRTRTTNAYITDWRYNLTPTQSQDTLIYDLSSLYAGKGGTVQPSDEGFIGTLYLEVAPTCDVPTNTYEDIDWQFNFNQSTALGSASTAYLTTNADRIRYRPTQLAMSSPAPVVDGLSKTVTWQLEIKNSTSNTDANNSWLHFILPSGDLTLVEVRDTDADTVLTQVSDIYPMGKIARNRTRKVSITAKYSACNADKLWVYTGYECSGYPSSYYAFTCPKSSYELRVEPKSAGIQARIKGATVGGACSGTVEVEVEVASVYFASADSIDVSFQLPASGSMSYRSGSSQFEYPLNSGWGGINDPQNGGVSYSYATAQVNSTLGSRGLPGVLNLDSNKFRLKFELDLSSQFKPGEYVQLTIAGQEICRRKLPTLNLAYDPSIRFEKNQTAGFQGGGGDSWSVSWMDYNGDGWEDVYFTEYDPQKSGQLWKNKGDGTFEKVLSGGDLTSALGGAVTSTWGDYDNDGDPDVFIANNIGAGNQLFRNDGNGQFTEVSAPGLVDYSGYCHGAAWGDYDNDGYLDLIVCEFMPTRFNLLYHNNGDGTFTRVESSVVTQEARYSIGASWADYDNDGDLDLFMPNTNNQKNSLFENMGGTFEKVLQAPFTTDSGNSVGSSWGDYDNDGDLDLFVTNAGNQDNFLYRNDGAAGFTKITNGAVVNNGGHSHGSAWADLDNDGDLDLFTANDQNGENFVYMNDGNGNFSRFQTGMTEERSQSFGVALADFDNDMDLDLMVANRAGNDNDFYENETGSCQSALCVKLTGTQSNRSAVGAKVRVKATIYGVAVWQMREVSAQSGGGAGGQSSLRQLIGLGDATQADSVIIEWPSGLKEYYTQVNLQNCMELTEPAGTLVSGRVFIDQNNNCQWDQGEQVLAHQTVELTPGPRYVSTNSEGNYETYLEMGAYTLALKDSSSWKAKCGASTITHSISVSGASGESHTGLDFPLQAQNALADVSVTIGASALRRGFRNNILVNYGNEGTVTAKDVWVGVEVDPDLVLVETSIPWDSVSQNTYFWYFDSLPVQAYGQLVLTDSVSLAATLGDWKNIPASITTSTAENNLANNQSLAREEIVGAVDPNDKLAWPRGFGAAHLVLASDTLTYKIRFQNIGNYPAARVVVLDTLSGDLDWTSLHDLKMSHDGEFTLFENGVLHVLFDGIELPDSMSDPLLSQGFISFKILPRVQTLSGTVIRNTAAIQFDFNDYIITNEVFHTVVDRMDGDEWVKMIVYPNPVQPESKLELVMTGEEHLPITIRQLQVFTLSGTLVASREIDEPGPVSLDDIPWGNGMYILKIRDEWNHPYTGKVMVR
ncbi:VCBS repeat-containing protein [bacterium SCSIO 12741]|nr:VCBS repeat-containing protein [bacterium SCSIO 12741]